MLCAYFTKCKSLTQHTPLVFVYGKEVVMHMEFLIPSLCIVLITCMIEDGALQDHLDELMKLKGDRFLAGFNQGDQKRQ